MSDVVAVSLITGVATVGAVLVTALFATATEGARASAEAVREQAKAVRDGRRPAVKVLREWIPQNAGLSLELGEIHSVPDEDKLKSLAARLRNELGDGSPDQTNLNAVLSGFSSGAIVTKVVAINEIRSKARAELKLLTPLVEVKWESLNTAK